MAAFGLAALARPAADPRPEPLAVRHLFRPASVYAYCGEAMAETPAEHFQESLGLLACLECRAEIQAAERKFGRKRG